MGHRRTVAAALTAAVVAAACGGCSRAIGGTPVAAPGEVGAAALVATTCRDYTAMKPAARREVILAIGADGNSLVAMNPDLWVGVAAALCGFVDPGAPVRDVVTGGVR